MHAHIKHTVQKIFNMQSLQQIYIHFCAYIIVLYISKDNLFSNDSVAWWLWCSALLHGLGSSSCVKSFAEGAQMGH
jgi:hypothetical protein